MKVRWKKVLATALSMVLTVGSVIPSVSADSGWQKEASGWQYKDAENKNWVESWMQDGENWYHFDSNGFMQTGWFQDTDGKWYFLDYHTGAMKTGWIKPKDGKWYFLDYHTGAMKMGWIKPMDGKWYFLDQNTGAMKTGWFQDQDKKWYYLDALSGSMQTGRVTIQGVMWTLQADGAWDGRNGVTISENLSWVSNDSDDSEESDSNDSEDNKEEQLPDFFVEKETGNVIIYKEGVYSADTFGIDEIQDLTISEHVGNGDITLDGLVVNGTTTIAGGGENTVHIVNCRLRIVIAAKHLTEGKNPLHISFEGKTTVSEAVHATTGRVKITIQENIVIPSLITDVASEISGAGSIDTLRITASIKVSLSVKVKQLRVDSMDVKPEVMIKSDVEVSEVAGVGAINVKITGKGTVYGYRNLTLDANGGYWILKEFDDTEKEETQLIVKIKVDQTIGQVLKEKEILPPEREGMEFNGWYLDETKTETGNAIDTEWMYCDRPYTFYAGWVRTEDIVPVKSAEILGSGYVGEELIAKANEDATGILTYQWYQCDTQDGVYQPIEGETSKRYRTDINLLEHYVKVEISSNHTETGVLSEAICIIPSSGGIPLEQGIIKNVTISGEKKVTYCLTGNIEWEEEGNNGFHEWCISDRIDGEYQSVYAGEFVGSMVSYQIKEEDAGKYIKLRVSSLNNWESEPMQISEEIPIIVKKVQAQIVVTGGAISIPEVGVSTLEERGSAIFTITASGSAVTVDQKTEQLVVSGSAVQLSQIQVTGTTNQERTGTYVWSDPSLVVEEDRSYVLYFIPEVLEGEEEKKIPIYVIIQVVFPPDYDIDIDIDVDIDIDIEI